MMAAPTTEPTAKANEERRFEFNLTPEAAQKVADALDKRGTPDGALRVGVKGGGCSGFSYVLQFEDDAPRARDLVFSYPVKDGEVNVYCDKKSILYLNGSTLEWQKTLMYQGFQFANPQEKSSCGCNESFAV